MRGCAEWHRGGIGRGGIKTTTGKGGSLRYVEIRNEWHGAPYGASVSCKGETPQRTRLGGQGIEQLTPRQALEVYLGTTNVPPDRAATLLKYANELIGDPAD